MKILQYAFLFLLVTFCTVTIEAQTWTSHQSQKEINALLDTGTELYMGTDAGLVVMNKSTLQKTLHNTINAGLTDNHIVAVTQAANGDVWVGTEGGTMEQFDGTNFSNVTTPSHSEFDQHTVIFDFKIAANNDFWCATNDGLFHKQGSTWLRYADAEFGTNFHEAWDIAINNAGEVFLATNDVFRFSNGVWSNILGSSTIENYLDADLFVSSTGDVFMSGDLSIIGRFDGTQWQEYVSPGSSGWKVQGFTEDTNGDIYASTTDSGVYKLIGNDWTKVVDAQTQAMGDEIAHFYIDSQNKRWLNSNIQLSVMDGANIQNTRISEHTLTTGSTRQLTKGVNGKLYFLTQSNQAISIRDAANNWSTLDLPTALASTWESYSDITVLSDTDIWISSSQGLYHYDGTTWTKPSSSVFRNMVVDSQGKIYIRGNTQIFVIENGVMSEYNASNSPMTGTQLSGHGIDRDDNLWLSENGTDTVRKRSTDGTWTEYTKADHPILEDKPQGEFHSDINGNLWMLANTVGVIKFDGTSFSNPYDGNIGQMSNYEVSSITSDDAGTMYFSHHYGITTWDNGQWGEFLISDVPNMASVFDSNIEMDDLGNIWWASQSYGVFALAGVAVLPVDLTGLAVETVSETAIELAWQTASEINNDYFSIEHSTDGENFRAVGKQTGNGTTSEGQNYTFLHRDLSAGQHYYRLKQIDFDGRFEYSEIVTARIKMKENGVSVMPNPTSGIINLETESAVEKSTDLQIINAQGQVVFASTLQSGAGNLTLDISDLPHGIYYLRMAIGSDLITKRIVKTQ